MADGSASPARVESAPLRLMRVAHRGGLVMPGALLLSLLVFLLLPEFIPLPPPTGGSVLESNQPMLSDGHILGTDMNGNDVASRLIHGGRTSLAIALCANLLGLVLGGMLGSCSAYRGGIPDAVTMRAIDTFLAVPSLMLILAISQIIEPTAMNIACALAVFSVPAFARVARTATLQVMREPYMVSAQVCGSGFWRVLTRHIAPAIGPSLLTFAMLGIGTVIILEGALSFLGFGIRAPQPSWGGMIYQGQQVLSATPRLVLLPGALLFLSVLSFNLLSQRLRARWQRA